MISRLHMLLPAGVGKFRPLGHVGDSPPFVQDCVFPSGERDAAKICDEQGFLTAQNHDLEAGLWGVGRVAR